MPRIFRKGSGPGLQAFKGEFASASIRGFLIRFWLRRGGSKSFELGSDLFNNACRGQIG
jgi:hypothetical protein